MRIRKSIANLILTALEEAQSSGALPSGYVGDTVVVEKPLVEEHGHLATSLPLKLAKTLGVNPLVIAETIVSHLSAPEFLEHAWAAPPGFVNFTLNGSWLAQQVEAILAEGEDYGTAHGGIPLRVQVEYSGVNPTGPLHVGHARGAILGSAIASILEAAGYVVTRENYINDAGTQMDIFYHSLYIRYLQALGDTQAELPTNAYLGSYLVDVANEVVAQEGDRFKHMKEQQAISEIGHLGMSKMLSSASIVLDTIRAGFDVWFREQSLYDQGEYEEAMGILERHGYLQNQDGAVWFTSSNLGDNRDNVLVRSNGAPTYFASDVAYHYNKFFTRGFDWVVNVWGADHQGHVNRMKAAVTTLGVTPEKLTVVIAQMVTLKRGAEVLKMSKRSGELITLQELVDEVGPDACRYFFLARSAESQMEFDLELAKEQSADNPVYYIQYAYARTASILRNAQEQGLVYDDGDVSLLTHEAELAIVRKMIELPELIELMAQRIEPHHLPHYALELATHFHWFYQQCRVISNDPALTKARLKLTVVIGSVLARCLHLMGMEAPEYM